LDASLENLSVETVVVWGIGLTTGAVANEIVDEFPREGDPRRRDFGRHTAILGWELMGPREKIGVRMER